MKTTKRFENAVSKLYNAFHENRLNAHDCSACAVGNMCDNDSSWFNPVCNARPCMEQESYFYDTQQPLISNVLENKVIQKTGYSGNELANVESLFMKFCGLEETKETQFNGLCAVIEYLCELDNIPNIMDYTSLFETENPKRELIEVFI